MGNSAADIVARLRLNGSEFSSETARVFGAMEAQARDTAARTRSAFEQSFGNIQDIAKRALAMPRDAGGALQLDVAGARQAVAVADAQAAALREVANAAEMVARKTNDTTENTRLYIQAARAAAMEAENFARETQQQAAALDLLQAELAQTRSATQLVIDGNQLMNASMRGGGMVAVQASQQFQDFFIQVGGGQSILVAGTQQLSQLSYVMQSAGGSAGKFATILSGPYGMAVIGTLTLLSLFGDKIFGVASELDKATASLEKNARQTAATEEAQRRFAETLPGVIAAIREQTEALEQQNRTLEENERQEERAADRNLARMREKRGDLFIQILQARQDLNDAETRLRAASPNDVSAAAQFAEATGRLEELQGLIKAVDAALANAEANARAAQRGRLDREVTEGMDAQARAAGNLRRELEALEKQRVAGTISNEKYKADQRAARERYEAEIKRLQEQREAQRRAEREAAKAPDADLTRFGWPVASGAQTGRFGEHRPGHRHAGVDIAVPVGTPVSAAAAGTVIEVGDLPGYGNVVVINHGRGTLTRYAHLSRLDVQKGDVVGAGDLLGLSGGAKGAPGAGNSRGPHLHYEVRRNGKAVDPSKGMFPADELAIAKQVTAARDEQAEALQRLLQMSEKQMSVEADTLRFMGMRVRGLDEQAATEAKIAGIRRDFAEQMEGLADKDREAQLVVDEKLRAQLATLNEQAAAYAALLVAAGDQESLTQDQKAALDDANAAMLVQLDAALALAKTAAERKLALEAIARIEGRIGTARQKGTENARDAKQRADEFDRAMKEAEQDRVARERDQINELAYFYRNAFSSGGKSIVEDFREEMLDMIAEVAARWTVAMLSGQKTSLGSILGDMGATSGVGGSGGLLGALGLFGKGGTAAGGLGSAAAGAANAGAAASGLSSAAGGAAGIGGAISSAMPYVAAAMAAFQIGSMIFGALAPKKWGSAGLSLVDGQVVGTDGWGRGSGQISGAASGASSVAQGLNRLAEQIDATITSLPGITVGTWDGKARVALTNTSKPLHSKNFGNDILKDFGEGGEQEALEYAIAYAFSNAAIEGISQASKNIVAKGSGDIQKAINKVMLIEDIPKRLQSMLDPVGYAIDQLNKSWEKTFDALREGSASAEQMAEAQKLYNLELEATKAQAREASADLKDFMKELNFGSGSSMSLRDQEALARASLQPFLDTIEQGGYLDQGKFREAAQAFLDLERQLYGSGGKYFEALDMVQAATNKAISTIDNAKPVRTVMDDAIMSTANNTATTNELLDQVSGQLAQISSQLAARGFDIGDFIGEPRGFVRAA